MNAWRYVTRSLFHHWRINCAVALGVAAATAVLTGALLIGDAMRGSLRTLTLDRLGRIDEILELLGARDVEDGHRIIRALIESTGRTASLNAIGVKRPEDIAALADGVNAERLGNNPRAFTRESLLAMLQVLHAENGDGDC